MNQAQQPEALRLADLLESDLCEWPIDEASAELRRLHQHELACAEWIEKTEWVQKNAQPRELGKHRADVIRARMEAQETELRRLHAENKEMNETLEFVERWAVHHGCKTSCTPVEALSCIQHYPAIKAITKSYSDGKVPNTFDPFARIAKLEAEAQLAKSLADDERDHSDEDEAIAAGKVQALCRGG